MSDTGTARAGGGRSRSDAVLLRAERGAGEEPGADWFEALLGQELRSMAETEPRPGLEGRVLARVRSETTQRALFGGRAAVAVASVLVLVLGAVIAPRSWRSRPQASVAAAPGREAAALGGEAVAVSREAVAPERKAAMPVARAPERTVAVSRRRARRQRRAGRDGDGLEPVQLEAFAIAPLRIQPLAQ